MDPMQYPGRIKKSPAPKGGRFLRFIKRILFVWVISSIVVGGALFVFLQYYFTPILKEQIESRGSSALGAPLTVKDVSVAIFPKPHFKISGVDFSVPAQNLKGTAEEARLTLDSGLYKILEGGALGVVNVALVGPKIEAILVPKTKDSNDPADDQPTLPPKITLSRDVGLRLSIKDGAITVRQGTQDKSKPGSLATVVRIEGLALGLDVPSVNGQKALLSLSGGVQVQQGETDLNFPVMLKTTVALDNEILRVTETSGAVFGLTFSAEGQQDLSTQAAKWKANLNVPEIANLPLPPSFLPAGKWSGKVSGALQAQRASSKTAWRARGQLSVTSLTGVVDFKQDDLTAKGRLRALGDLRFDVFPKPDLSHQISITRGDLAANLTELAIEKKDLFRKPAGVLLSFALNGTGTDKEGKIENFEVKFAGLRLTADGELRRGPGKESSISTRIERTELAGWEAYFPPLASAPVKGAVQLAATIQGDLEKPESLRVEVRPLQLDKIEASVQWASQDGNTSVSGPVRLDGLVNLNAIGQDLRGADVRLQGEFSGLKLVSKGSFEKPAGLPLSLSLTAAQKGQQIEVKSSRLVLGSSHATLSGQVSNPQRPQLGLKLLLGQLNLGELTRLSPKSKDLGLSGSASGSVEVSGVYDFKEGIEKSPLRVKADLKAKIPSLKIERAEPSTAKAPAKTEPAAPPPEPLLPPWPVARTATAKVDVQIDRLQYGTEVFSGVQAIASLNNSQLSGLASIQQIFGGSAKVTRFQTQLDQPRPSLVADAEVSGIDMARATGFASPDWKDLARGKASGKVRMTVPHPSRSDFLERLQSQGTLDLKDAYFSTVNFDQLVNRMLAKIPGIGSGAAVETKGVAAEISGAFDLDKKVMKLPRFHFLTPEKNELKATGTLDLDKNIELDATAFLATASVGGAVREANSDASGRFVVPIRIKGNLLKPEVSFAKETVAALLKKTAERETGKLAAQAKAKLQSEVEKEGKKHVDKLQEELKKKGLEGLKGVFGQ